MTTRMRGAVLVLVGLVVGSLGPRAPGDDAIGPRRWVAVRGVYGGIPTQLIGDGRSLAGSGVNAVWIGSGGLTREGVALAKSAGAKVFAEFNSMHDAAFVKEHPDAAPVGVDGMPCPPPDGWQGACPTHPGYRAARMSAFRRALTDFEIDGVWLDYHHAQASWEQAGPNLPDTCFCDRCIGQFRKQSGVALPDAPTRALAPILLGPQREAWVHWRCGLFTDWVRQYRAIRDEARPGALLGTFHCPWSDDERGGALRASLAIDLKAQAEHIDVFSPMPYHARFGHATDPAWISRQTAWLGRFLGVEGKTGERLRIWPIVQLSDWGERVPASQTFEIIDHGTRAPATGVTVFAWGSLARDRGKVDQLVKAYRSIRPVETSGESDHETTPPDAP